MRVALPLLTLVPGISGGSETYARELCRALGTRRRARRTRRSCRRSRRTPATGSRRSSRPGIARRPRPPGRLAAMGRAAVWPGALRERRRSRSTSSTTRSPCRCRPPTGPTVLDPARRPASRPAAALPARRAPLPAARVRPGRRARGSGDRDQRLGPRPRGRAARPRPRARPRDPPRRRPRRASAPRSRDAREPFLYYPARPWPHKNHARLFDGLRSPPGRPARAAARAHRRGPRRLVPAGGRRDARRRRRSRRASTSTAAPRPSSSRASTRASGCRRSRRWPAAARSRPRPPDRCPEVVGDAAVLFDPDDPDAIAAGVEEALERSTELGALGIARAARFTWEATARAHDRVYERALAS